VEIFQFLIKQQGHFPNNAQLPVVLYKQAMKLPDSQADQLVIKIFHLNHWRNAWVNGIYDYHHYHSITHEVLGIFSGQATVMLGGERGMTYDVRKGDVMIIPAGVAHKCVKASHDFKCVGAYPGGKDFDILRGKAEEEATAIENIHQVPMPELDPVYGKDGHLFDCWKRKSAYTNKDPK
jgi:uncharacterized protein YjlB